jgi:uncharacterized protein (TIGR00290 family)
LEDIVPEEVIFTWSGGKDSALALHELLNSKDFTVKALLTTVNEDFDRVSMHGFLRKLLKRQAEELQITLEQIMIPMNCTNDEYDGRMRNVLEKYLDHNIQTVVFGDIYLKDVRKYRENNLAKIGMKGLFPLWNQNTEQLARKFLNLRFKAIITCIDSKALSRSFAGKEFDEQFLNDLPTGVDPCGENGEFHTFVYDGPIFNNKIDFEKGDIVLKNDRFYYCDLTPK